MSEQRRGHAQGSGVGGHRDDHGHAHGRHHHHHRNRDHSSGRSIERSRDYREDRGRGRYDQDRTHDMEPEGVSNRDRDLSQRDNRDRDQGDPRYGIDEGRHGNFSRSFSNSGSDHGRSSYHGRQASHSRASGANESPLLPRQPSRPNMGMERAPPLVRGDPHVPAVNPELRRSRSPVEFGAVVADAAYNRPRRNDNVINVATPAEPGPSHGGRGRAASDRGRGRGGGRGGAGEGRGRGRGRGRRDDAFDMVISRPVDEQGQRRLKQAALGISNSKPIKLEGNFFKVVCRPDWCVFHYRVDFNPEETDTRIKKKLLRAHSQNLGKYVFDGSSLYVIHELSPDLMTLTVIRETDQQRVELKIKLVGQLAPTDVMYLQLLNIIVRKCMETMELDELGRHFYDRNQAIRIEAHRLELWPGFKTSLRSYENGLMFNVELTHKVLRLDNCLRLINSLRQLNRDESQLKDAMVGSIVMTIYNRKTYRVDDLEWGTTPMSTFDMRGREITFVDYFREKYNLTIREGSQPMLVSRPTKKDFHRGMTGPILLVPELCQQTGLSDEMRANNQLMRALATHLHLDPERRVQKLGEFIRRLNSTPGSQQELSRWGLQFQSSLVNFQGHTMPSEAIKFGDKQPEVPNEAYDWGAGFRNKSLLSNVPLKSWVVIVPSRDAHAVDRLVSTMTNVSRPLKFHIDKPMFIHRLCETRPLDYSNAVDRLMAEYKDNIKMIFAILPKHALDTYSAVKKRTFLDFGVPSQCFVVRNLHNDRGLMSVCTKLVVQMAAKLGGEPWMVKLPPKNTMVVGFDVHHCGKRTGSSVGAMVATTNKPCTKYFSCYSFHSSRDGLSESMGADFRKCLMGYLKVNEELPSWIVLYRDGVGEGQLKYVHEVEVKAIELALEEIYKPKGKEIPRFTFVVVTKKINTRMFALARGRHVNPPPGTVADDVITHHERYDFYLISQHSRQGTVSPVSYHILKDTSGFGPERMQMLTFKLCHLYFNWSSTVTVPAPCQYAKKLAYLAGTALGGRSHEKLANSLYFL